MGALGCHGGLPLDSSSDASYTDFLVETVKASLVRRASRERPIRPVFHYTSPHAFAQIIRERKIWLTNAAYLNDPNELRYGSELIGRVLNERLESYSTLADLMERRFLERLAERVGRHVSFKPWYTVSFSMVANRLSQWRAYCPDGGFALGLDGKAFADAFSDHFAVVGPVCYDESDQRERVSKLVDQLCDDRQSLREKYSAVPDEVFEEQCLADSVNTLVEEILFIKVPAFAEEEEWRLGLHAAVAEETIRFRSRNELLVPYVELELPAKDDRLPLDSVWIGPLGDQQLLKHASVLVLSSTGYEKPEKLIHSAGFEIRRC